MKKLLILFTILLLPHICFATDVEVVVRGMLRKIIIEVYTFPYIFSDDIEKKTEKKHHSYKEIRTSEPIYTYMLRNVPDGYWVDVNVEIINKQVDEFYKYFSIEMIVDEEYYFGLTGYVKQAAQFKKYIQ